MDKVYLAPCPFCAGGAKKDEFDPYDGYQGRNTVYRVRCRECGAEVQADRMEDSVDGFEVKQLLNEAISLGYIEKAVAIVEKWAREHPEERSE